jgi:20S proteasome alpha/beta subunit
MTIAAGFVAKDGVVLCTDSQYTGGIKMNGKKIFPFPSNGVAIAFAIAGHEAFSTRAIEECCTVLDRSLQGQTSIPAIKDLIERGLRSFYRKHIFVRPANDRDAGFKLLVAIGNQQETPCLFVSTETVLNPVRGRECQGVGSYVGHHVIENAYRPDMSLEEAVVLGIHAVAMAKEYVDGVGGPTQLLWIKKGIASTFHPLNATIFTENYMMSFERRSADLLFDAANPKLSEQDFQARAQRFLEHLGFIRQHWRESFEHKDILEMLLHPTGSVGLESRNPDQ